MGALERVKGHLGAHPNAWLLAAAVVGVGAVVVLTIDLARFLSSRSMGWGLLAALLLGAGMVCWWSLRAPLTTIMATFIVLVVFASYLLVSVDIAGLNLRASQLFLPLVLLRLLVMGAFWRVSWSQGWLAAAGAALWGAFVFWTIVRLPELPSATSALGRVALLGINLIHALAAYLLVVRTQAWRLAAKTLVYSVAAFNLVLMVIALGAAQDIPGLTLASVAQPVLEAGAISTGLAPRFGVGVVTGVLSAAVLAFPMAAWAQGKRLSLGLMGLALTALLGMVIGFSRQSLVSLAGAVGVIGGVQLLRGRAARLMRLGFWPGLIIVAGLWLSSQLSVTRPFYQAFAARALLLFRPVAYETGTVADRVVMWAGMLREVAANPFVGAGQDAYLQYYPQAGEGSHNFPIEVLHATGVWGFLPYLLLHGVVMLKALRLLRRRELGSIDRAQLLACLAAFVAVFLSSLTNLIFWNPAYWLLLGLLAGTTRAMGKTLARQPAQLDNAR